jgi:hypothetical protein
MTPRKKLPSILKFVLICLGCSPALLRAQPVPVQQFDENQQKRQLQDSLLNLQTTTTNAPELYPGENQDVGPQHILRMVPRRTFFEVLADTQYAFTDNNRLAHGRGITTAYAINTVQLAFAPEPVERGEGVLASRVGFRSQWYNYGLDGSGGGEDSLDFNGQTAFGSLQYLVNRRWEFDAEIDYTRLLTQRNYSEFYSEGVPSLGVTRLFPIKSNLLLGLGWQGDYHVSSVPSIPGSPDNVNDRLDNTLSMTLTWQVTGNLIFQPYYRFEVTRYPRTSFDTDRDDYLQTVGSALSYYFTRQLAARIFISEQFRTSDDPNTTSYSKLDTGIGASFVCRF